MPGYSIYAFQNDSDRSATLENLTPVVDPIASTTSTQLKLSSFPNPHIAWIYYKVDALTHFILETKLRNAFNLSFSSDFGYYPAHHPIAVSLSVSHQIKQSVVIAFRARQYSSYRYPLI